MLPLIILLATIAVTLPLAIAYNLSHHRTIKRDLAELEALQIKARSHVLPSVTQEREATEGRR